uniref:Uncharacterized protein n=1 Tax=viral metagenome TaxID=1070528 RepID=A0A6C0CJX0_9ZZZZ
MSTGFGSVDAIYERYLFKHVIVVQRNGHFPPVIQLFEMPFVLTFSTNIQIHVFLKSFDFDHLTVEIYLDLIIGTRRCIIYTLYKELVNVVFHLAHAKLG